MKVLVINGPNLNLLGSRKPDVYGNKNLDQVNDSIRATLPEIDFDFFQSNHEGELIDRIQDADGKYEGIVLNPGAFTHYSFAIRDAIEAVEIPIIEVHISNVHSREDFRRQSVVADVCCGTISGFGVHGYILAVKALQYEMKA